MVRKNVMLKSKNTLLKIQVNSMKLQKIHTLFHLLLESCIKYTVYESHKPEYFQTQSHTSRNVTQANVFPNFFFLEECFDCVRLQKRTFDVNLVCGALWLIQLSSIQF